jgi:hypothetical protein
MIKNRRGQAVFSEYVLLMFIVVGMVTAMTVYFRRTLQARIQASRNMMVKYVDGATGGDFAGNGLVEYEPYYGSTSTTSEMSSASTDQLFVRGASEKIINERKSIRMVSETAPPKDAN